MTYKKFDPAIAERKQKNAAIFRLTTKLIKDGGYTNPSNKHISFNFTKMLQLGKCFQQELPAISAPDVDGGTKVMVEDNDCLVAAERLVKGGYKPALLNFASAGHPGGGVETGARAQEETICRRSTLTRSIYSFDQKYAARYNYPLQPGEHYPIVSEFSAVYSPAVTVFRDGIECLFMEEPYDVAVITCAALNLGGKYSIKLTPDGHMPQKAIDITRNKIRTVFRIGLMYGHDSLVLGAFGCGAFKNPPAEIAKLFHEVMEEPEFKNKYRLITFSIIDDHNSNNANLAAFKAEFEEKSQYALVFVDSDSPYISDLQLEVEVFNTQEDARAALLDHIKEAIGEEEYNALEPDENGKRVYKTPWYEDEIIITPDSMTGKSGEGMHNDVYVLKVRNHKQL